MITIISIPVQSIPQIGLSTLIRLFNHQNRWIQITSFGDFSVYFAGFPDLISFSAETQSNCQMPPKKDPKGGAKGKADKAAGGGSDDKGELSE